ncbi:hypothetical protein NDU88_003301 [Pleurodeles waltl]|uniref:Uncharacterized protein n=1 Tax=Pleurodeles waltl TaxID=8319 RepID=A0AAV7Q8K9_PLEWA|nr:hypothetical protein NDU88_003301 [Pleurodeles waltl]
MQVVLSVCPVILHELQVADCTYIEVERWTAEDPLLRLTLAPFCETEARLLEWLYFVAYTARTHSECERSAKVLAWLANRDTRQETVLELHAPDKGVLHSQQEIHEAFTAYYTVL